MKQRPKQAPPSERVTMHDIAARARVSLGTVSHVLNESAAVREPLKKRVLEAIADLGYQPNNLSRGLRRNRTNLIGMIIPDITNPFFPSVVRGVEDMAYKASYRLLLCNTDNNVEKETAYFNDLRSFLPAGMIVIPSIDHKLEWNAASLPVVCIDRKPRDWKGDSVTVANEDGGYAAARHLIEMGHRTVGIVRGPAGVYTAEQRVAGFLRGMAQSKIRISSEYIQEGRFDRESGYTCTARLLSLLPRPTAIFTASDLLAIGALTAIKAAKLQCPRDVSIVSFDGLDFTELTDPALTSIFQPSYQLGCTAMQLLLNRIDGLDSPPQDIVLATEIRMRDSVRRLEVRI